MKRARASRIFLQLVFILFLLPAPFVSSGADFYRWTDEEGVTHISNQPPDNAVLKGNDLKVLKMKENPSDEPTGAADQNMTDTPGQYVIPFQKLNGAMIVDVILNDQVNAKMLLDTGASMTSINVGLLKKLNQTATSKRLTGKAITAGGTVDVNGIMIEKIDLGGAVKRNVWVAYSDEKYDFAGCDGLLGMSFLSDFKFTIDYGNNTITLHKP